jgi:hypothetical protein
MSSPQLRFPPTDQSGGIEEFQLAGWFDLLVSASWIGGIVDSIVDMSRRSDDVPRGKPWGRLYVRVPGLEPGRLSAPGPKPGASANSATPACGCATVCSLLLIGPRHGLQPNCNHFDTVRRLATTDRYVSHLAPVEVTSQMQRQSWTVKNSSLTRLVLAHRDVN